MGGSVRRIADVDGARDLARLLNSARERPVAVVTTPAGSCESFIDAERLADDVGDVVDVYLLPTGPESWAFSAQMPELTQVYGGAGRAYPVDLGWVTDPRRSPLRLAFDRDEGVRATELLVSDALAMANAAGLIGRSARGGARLIEGEVKGFATSDRALVRTAGGGFASVVPELAVPGVPLPRVLAPGMRVCGLLDSARRLDVGGMLQSAAAALAGYGLNDVALARVEIVRPDEAVVLLHPDVEVLVDRAEVTSNDLDDLTTLMSTGEVLRVRITSTGPRWRVTLIDLDDDEVARPAAALIPGGPPWLLEGASDEVEAQLPADGATNRPVPVGPSPTPRFLDPGLRGTGEAVPASPASPTPQERAAPSGVPQPRPAPPPVPPLARLREELVAVREDLRRVHDELSGLRQERNLLAKQNAELQRRLAEAEESRRALRTQLRRSRGRSGVVSRSADWFLDPEEQFRYDVHAAWVRRTPACEKDRRPLPPYAVGPEFVASLRGLEGIDPQRIADVAFEVLTGRAKDLPGRDLHPLRASRSGNAPQVVRATDGAAAWRVALQKNSPGARRMHYWVLPNGHIELSRVGLHDELRP